MHLLFCLSILVRFWAVHLYNRPCSTYSAISPKALQKATMTAIAGACAETSWEETALEKFHFNQCKVMGKEESCVLQFVHSAFTGAPWFVLSGIHQKHSQRHYQRHFKGNANTQTYWKPLRRGSFREEEEASSAAKLQCCLWNTFKMQKCFHEITPRPILMKFLALERESWILMTVGSIISI